ncbi:hypothetical protein C8R45DRAFT_986563 [Mycena sanguinolenta]|nr:hypothetical protein C8R45DRAFT_986563 [Mycena sanguinolenta]
MLHLEEIQRLRRFRRFLALRLSTLAHFMFSRIANTTVWRLSPTFWLLAMLSPLNTVPLWSIPLAGEFASHLVSMSSNLQNIKALLIPLV